MAITYSAPVRTSDRTVKLGFVSSLGASALKYVYQDGILIATTTAEEWIFQALPGTALIVEVLDDADALPEDVFPGRVTLGWHGEDNVESYLIEEFIDAAWTTRATILDDGSGYYAWTSRFLEDVTTHQFRITPTGTNGQTGAVRAFSAFMVRNPDTPVLSSAFDEGTGKVTWDTAA